MNDTELLPMLSLREIVLFPHMIIPIFVGREASLAAINASFEDDNDFQKMLVCVAQLDPAIDEIEAENLYSVGTEAHILQRLKLPDGTQKLLIEGKRRVSLKSVSLDEPFHTANFSELHEKPADFATIADRVDFTVEAVDNAQKLLEERQPIFGFRAGTRSGIPLFPETKGSVDEEITPEVRERVNKWLLNQERVEQGEIAKLSKSEIIKNIESFAEDSAAFGVEPDAEIPAQDPVEEMPWQFPRFEEYAQTALKDMDVREDPGRWVDTLVPQLRWPVKLQQSFLEDTDVARRIKRLHRFAKNGFDPVLSPPSPKENRNTREIFISHANADKDRIAPFVARLVEEGYRVFIDRPDEIGLSENPLVSGLKSGPFRAQLKDALERTACVLTFWSKDAVRDDRTELQEEAAFGKSADKLVQVALEPRDQLLPKLPLGFSEWHLLDVSEEAKAFEDNETPSLAAFLKEIQDVVDVDPITGSPQQPSEQQSKSVKLAVVGDVLRTIERPPPVAPEAPVSTLNQLRDMLIAELTKVVSRLEKCQHMIEEDIHGVAKDIIAAFDKPLEEINTIIAPSIGENLLLMEDVLRNTDVRREVADHLMFSIPSAARAYRDFIDLWADWKDQLSDPALMSVTPENADETRAAADLVTEFARGATHIVDEGVPSILDAMRRLIRTNYGVSRFNEYRYLNAIGEGLRACWDAARGFIVAHWLEIKLAIVEGREPQIGPFGAFFLEMGDALEQLARANPDLFGWLHTRVGYLRRLKAGQFSTDLSELC